MSRPAILLVDNEPCALERLTRALDEEFEVRIASNPVEAERILADDDIQVVISGQWISAMGGSDFLARVGDRWPDLGRIVVSDHTGIDGDRQGIHQYVSRPWHPDNLLLIVRNACRLVQLQRENARLSRAMQPTARHPAPPIDTGRGAAARGTALGGIVRRPGSPLDPICDQIARIAPYDIPVLLTGESGTGKELLARALHDNSPRADKPFVAENVGAMPEHLLESELFGHERGAFTGAVSARVGLFEQADGGTIFLDEIGEVSTAFQVKLLRVLQEQDVRPVGANRRRKVNVRVVAATNRDLEQEMRAGRFREDLYYRLAGVRVHLPPLRDRPMDIAALAQHILDAAQRVFAKPVDGFTPEALECLTRYRWPGNVRELQNEIQRVLVLAPGRSLGADLLDPRILRADGDGPARSTALPHGLDPRVSLKDRVEMLEASILRETLIRHRWNKTQAAEELGLSRVGLRSKLERYGLIPAGKPAASGCCAAQPLTRVS